MTNKIMETLENIEERLENIKFLITLRLSPRLKLNSHCGTAIKKSAGILGNNFPKGTVFENTARREWRTNSGKRIR